MKNHQITDFTTQEENIQSYFRLHLEEYFKASHPIQRTASFLFPPLAFLKEMFGNIHYGNHLPMQYPPQFSNFDPALLSVPLLWQILIYNIAYPPHNTSENEASWKSALCARLAHRAQMEELFFQQHDEHFLDPLKTLTLIHPQIIDLAIKEQSEINLWRLKFHAYADFYLSLISTFDQAVTEDMIIFCAEENITLSYEFTDLTDSGFIGQILPTKGKSRPIMPDNHLLDLFYRRENQGEYFLTACRLAEQIGSHDWENYLLGHIIRCQQVTCNDWRAWLAQSGNCSTKEIPPLLLDLFFLSRAMSKFIQYQNKQLKMLGVKNSEEEIINIYQRYPLYFNQSETFQG